MAPVLIKMPPNGPYSLKCYLVPLYQVAHPVPGTQLSSLVLILVQCGPHKPRQVAPYPLS